MDLALKIVYILFIFLALDRVLLFFERRYYAKYGVPMLEGTDEKDLNISRE